jgi:hypothetical protein
MEESSGWKRIQGDFGKFWLIIEITPPQYPSFPFIALIPKQALKEVIKYEECGWFEQQVIRGALGKKIRFILDFKFLPTTIS